ncbi:MAG TPA: hypothetical protein VJQ56_11680, partial [Blastocatellia bacterium]|nr:hypothetical protein [Blastocatellia bacterium]
MSAKIDKAIASGLLLTVVFTALAYGTVEAWSVAVFELAIIALVSLWLIKSYIDRRLSVAIPQAALPVAAFALLGVAQSITFRGASLSADSEATRMAVTVVFVLLASFIIAANFFNTRERLFMLGNFLIIYGFAMALFALVQHLAWDGRFYWVRPNTQGGSPFGPFVNHSHFAGYMEM